MTSGNTNSSTATVEEATAALVNLGVEGSPVIGAAYDPTLVLGWCRWAQERRRRGQAIGTGLIVSKITAGEQPPSRTRSLIEEQRVYGEQIAAWLRRHFPDLDRPRWGPHPAAVVEVIRLHHRHGKGQLTKQGHGPAIRAAVAAWEARHAE